MGPTSKIAALLEVSLTRAASYCEEVRSISGLGSSLPYKIIASQLEQHLPELLSPQKMAEILEKVQFKPTSTRPHISKSRKQRRSKKHDDARPIPAPGYLVRTSYFDRERVAEDKLGHCPHGVPHGRVCAICDPKKFREMTGID